MIGIRRQRHFVYSQYHFARGKGSFAFDDDGTAFVDALERRTSSFGSLYMDFSTEEVPFSCANLERLFKLEVFDKLTISNLQKECVLLPFSAKVNALDCEIDTRNTQPSDFDSLDIAAKDITVKT